MKITIVGKSDLTGMLLRQTSPSRAAKALRAVNIRERGLIAIVQVISSVLPEHIVEISWFFYHSYFTWNHFLGIVEVQNVPF